MLLDRRTCCKHKRIVSKLSTFSVISFGSIKRNSEESIDAVEVKLQVLFLGHAFSCWFFTWDMSFSKKLCIQDICWYMKWEQNKSINLLNIFLVQVLKAIALLDFYHHLVVYSSDGRTDRHIIGYFIIDSPYDMDVYFLWLGCSAVSESSQGVDLWKYVFIVIEVIPF